MMRALLAGALLLALAACNKSTDPTPTTAAVDTTSTNQFTPPGQTLKLGGTVTFNNKVGFHNVTFSTVPAGVDAAQLSASTNDFTPAPKSVTRTLNVAGEYDFLCSIHGQSMSGKITVK